MKVQDVLILGGIGVVIYLLITNKGLKNPKRVVQPAMPEIKVQEVVEPTPIVLMPTRRASRGSLFPSNIVADFDTRKASTFAPAKVVVSAASDDTIKTIEPPSAPIL